MQKITHSEILARQARANEKPRLPFVVLLNNIRSLYNIGSIFRTSDGAGISKIYLCGICGHPPNDRIKKTALGAEENVDWEYQAQALPVIRKLRDDGYEVVLLEQIKGSVSYEQYVPKRKVCLVIGNEIEGVAASLLPHADLAVEIEMRGIKNSLNVAVAFGIVAFHVSRQLMQRPVL